MIEPRDNSLHGLDRWHCGEYRPTEHQDRKAQRSRGLDLAVGRSAAAVLGHDQFDKARREQRSFVGFAVGTASHDVIDTRQIERRVDRINAANKVIMLRCRSKRREFLAPKRKEDAAGRLAKRVHRGQRAIDLDPTVARDRQPGRPPQCEEANARRLRGARAIGRDHGGIGMRRIDERVDPFCQHISREPLGAAEAADPHRYGKGRWRRRAPGKRQCHRKVATAAQALRQLPRFPRTAENESTHDAR